MPHTSALTYPDLICLLTLGVGILHVEDALVCIALLVLKTTGIEQTL